MDIWERFLPLIAVLGERKTVIGITYVTVVSSYHGTELVQYTIFTDEPIKTTNVFI